MRYTDKNKNLMESMKFPAEFATKVDMTKVNMDVMRQWITQRIVELTGLDDDVVPEYVFGMLEPQVRSPTTALINA
jgi:hypothetical protein